MFIASKEARETEYWLRLLEKSNLVDLDCSKNIHEVVEIIKMLTAIIITTKQNLNGHY